MKSQIATRKARLEALKADILAIVEGEDNFIPGTVDEFYGRPETYWGLWASGESGEIDGLPVFDAYGPFGPFINDEIKPILAKHNAFADWYDAGTVHITLED